MIELTKLEEPKLNIAKDPTELEEIDPDDPENVQEDPVEVELELGEELLPYQGVVYYPEENEVEQTTAIFIPQDDKEFLEVLPLPSKDPNASDLKIQYNSSLETTTDETDNHNDYQEEETTVPPEYQKKENKIKNKNIFLFAL